MSIEQSLVEYLEAQAPLTALVGSKIYAGIIPQGTVLPAVSFIAAGGGPTHSLSGVSGYQMRTYRFSVWTEKEDMLTLVNIANALENELDGYRGVMGTTTATDVQRIMLMQIRDFFEPDSESQQRVLEFDIDYCYGAVAPS